MHPLRFPIIADENIHPEVVQFLRQQGLSADSINERKLQGSSDRFVVALAIAEQRVILTHDADFGKILHTNEGIQTGVIFLRPGHTDYQRAIQSLQTILTTKIDVEIPFLIVADRSGDNIKIRIRQL